MTLVRSNKDTPDRLAARRHAPRTAKNQVEESADAARARNTHYLQQARAYEVATGESPSTLQAKRRWVQAEFAARRISGKSSRELLDLYSRRNITKPAKKRAKVDGLTEDAKEVKRRLEDAFAQEPKPVADAGDGSAAVSDNAAVKEPKRSSKRGNSTPKAAVTAATQKPTAAEIAALVERNRLPDLALRFRRPATSADGGGEERGGSSGEDVEMGGTEDVDVGGR